MSHRRICSSKFSSIGFLVILLHILDRSLAQLDGYIPDQDYPIYTEVPLGLSFSCDDKIPGYYADPETRCQVWHWCVPSIGGNEKYSFICAPGTVFNQRTRVCDYFYKVDCPNAPAYYSINEDLYKDEAGNYINGKKGNSYSNVHDRRRLTARMTRYNHLKRPTDTTDKKTYQKTDRKTDRTDRKTNTRTDRNVKKRNYTNGHSNGTNI